VLAGLAALALAGFEAPEAHAAWYCKVLDGPSSTNSGAMNASMAVGAAIEWNGTPLPFYLAVDSSGTQYIRYALWNDRVRGGPWFLHTLDVDNAQYTITSPPTALGVGGTFFDAYGAYNKTISTPEIVIGQGGPVKGTPLPVSSLLAMDGGPSLVSYADDTYVFFTGNVDCCSGTLNYMRTYGSGWSGPYTVDTNVGPGTPSAAVFNGSLHVFYNWNGALVDRAYNAISWGPRTYVDVAATDPSAILDTSTNTLHVFYGAYEGGPLPALVDASLTGLFGATWSIATVDSDYDGTTPAPYLTSSNQLQVFYGGESWTARGATLSNGSWTYQVAIDGGTGSLCALQGGGATTDYLAGPVAISPWGTSAAIFYSDFLTGDLRYAYWQ
jgi:hypothetical protein